jgi:hypothetical protein
MVDEAASFLLHVVDEEVPWPTGCMLWQFSHAAAD